MDLDPFEGYFYRKLTGNEIAMAKSVFGNTLPLDKVRVTGQLGLGDRQFTVPGNLILGLAVTNAALNPITYLPGAGLLSLAEIGAAALVQIWIWDKYLVNMGPTGFAGDTSGDIGPDEDHPGLGQILIHELTHVWQGVYGAFQWQYILDSIYYQTVLPDAYVLDKNNLMTWADYEVEQQAELVRLFFFRSRMPATFPVNAFFPYVRDNILPGKPNAPTDLSFRAPGWARCTRCQALYFSGAFASPVPAGFCPVTGLSHVPAPKSSATLVNLLVRTTSGMDGHWRKCDQCAAVFHEDIPGPCPGSFVPESNSFHTSLSGVHFFVPVRPPGATGPAWGKCTKCGVLFQSSFAAPTVRDVLAAGALTGRNGARSRSPLSQVCAAGGNHAATAFFTVV